MCSAKQSSKDIPERHKGPVGDISHLLDGHISFQEKLMNILVHGVDAAELESYEVNARRTTMTTFGVLLRGKLQFALNGQWCEVDAGQLVSHDQQPRCFVLNSLTHCDWQRRLLPENRVRKLTLSMSPKWLEEKLLSYDMLDARMSRIISGHAVADSWAASEATSGLAEGVLERLKVGGSLLALEGAAHQLLASCIQDFSSCTTLNQEFEGNHIEQDAARIMRYVEAQLSDEGGAQRLSLDAIAANLGYSVSKVQRLFSRNYGRTVVDYIRRRRLEMARESILHGKASIGEAAFVAGYNHVSNFTLAFKRYFGVTPGDVHEL